MRKESTKKYVYTHSMACAQGNPHKNLPHILISPDLGDECRGCSDDDGVDNAHCEHL